jgi:hypothetical protein
MNYEIMRIRKAMQLEKKIWKDYSFLRFLVKELIVKVNTGFDWPSSNFNIDWIYVMFDENFDLHVIGQLYLLHDGRFFGKILDIDIKFRYHCDNVFLVYSEHCVMEVQV